MVVMMVVMVVVMVRFVKLLPKYVVIISRRMCNVVLRRRRAECQVTREYQTDAQGPTICVVKSH